MSDKQQQYGIIREQGEYNDFKPLNDKDNRSVNESANEDKESGD